MEEIVESNHDQQIQHLRGTSQLVGKLSDGRDRGRTYDAFVERKIGISAGEDYRNLYKL